MHLTGKPGAPRTAEQVLKGECIRGTRPQIMLSIYTSTYACRAAILPYWYVVTYSCGTAVQRVTSSNTIDAELKPALEVTLIKK